MSNTFKVGDVTTTRDGRKARIICVDRVSKDYPVIALIVSEAGTETVTSHTPNGLFMDGLGGHGNDLMPVPRLEDLKVDTPLLVRDAEDAEWAKRHFAEVIDGKLLCWTNGGTAPRQTRRSDRPLAVRLSDCYAAPGGARKDRR